VDGAKIAGLLSDGERLRVFAAVALGAKTVEDVADAAGLDVVQVQGALPRLIRAGLIERNGGFHVGVAALRSAARERPPRQRELAGATPEQAKILRNFAEDGRLKEIPARAAQRRIVLEYLAARFERGRSYTEAEVNELLTELHPDYATLRRYLVDERLLERERGVYRRR
jgi:hypothetical protein